MSDQQLIEKTAAYVQSELQNAEGGHDWFHIERVWKNAKAIAAGENVNMLVVELSALLHDIADSKFHKGDEELGPLKARDFLQRNGVEEKIIFEVEQIIRHISFKGGKEQRTYFSPELAVVQDADRLDAIGAIGIARAFNYGGYKGRELYNPAVKPNLNMSKEEYKNSAAPTLNHFYEKLLLLKDRMNTETGKKIAEARHSFMEDYLTQFYKEWNGIG
ncbi:MAG: HD domain-containing protein [Chitinophagales bacterium]